MAEGDFVSDLEGPLHGRGACNPLDLLTSIGLLSAIGCSSVNGTPVDVIPRHSDCTGKYRHTAKLIIVPLPTFYIRIDCTLQQQVQHHMLPVLAQKVEKV